MIQAILLLVIVDIANSMRIRILTNEIKDLNERINKLEDKSDS